MGLFPWLNSTILPKLLNNSLFGRHRYISKLCKKNTEIIRGTEFDNQFKPLHFIQNLQIVTRRQLSYSTARPVSEDCWHTSIVSNWSNWKPSCKTKPLKGHWSPHSQPGLALHQNNCTFGELMQSYICLSDRHTGPSYCCDSAYQWLLLRASAARDRDRDQWPDISCAAQDQLPGHWVLQTPVASGTSLCRVL